VRKKARAKKRFNLRKCWISQYLGTFMGVSQLTVSHLHTTFPKLIINYPTIFMFLATIK